MQAILRKIYEEATPIYDGSQFYRFTILAHVTRVAEYAGEFAEKLGANCFVARAAGFLHDIGAAEFGKDNHHITGKRVAKQILQKCKCPPAYMRLVLDAIFRHRGSQKMQLVTLEDRCVAAADAKDHFVYLEELWLSRIRDLRKTPLEAHADCLAELEQDWAKTHPKIREMLNGTYLRARQKLLEIASANGCKKRRRIRA